MDELRWVICFVLGIPSAILILLNWMSVAGRLIAFLRGGAGKISFTPPFLCGIAGVVACLSCPLPGVWRWAWLPLLIDPSITLLLGTSALHVLAGAFRLHSPFDRPIPQPRDEQNAS